MTDAVRYSEQFVERAEDNYRFRLFLLDGCVHINAQEWDHKEKTWMDKGAASGIPKMDLPEILDALKILAEEDEID